MSTTTDFDLKAPVQFVRGIGPARAAALRKLGIACVEDLLMHLPMRYEDRRSLVRIADLQPGMAVSVRGEIVIAGLRRTRRMNLYEVRVQDDSGRLKALWFNQGYLRDVLVRGAHVVLFGKVERDSYGGGLLMSAPHFERTDGAAGAVVHSGRVVPVYERLGPLSSNLLRRVVSELAARIPDDLPDPLPLSVRQRLGVVGRGEALRRAHLPEDDDPVEALNQARGPAQRRLILEELFLFQLGLLQRKHALQARPKAVRFEISARTRAAVKQILPFPLTAAQKRVLKQIADDMCSPHPMHRLIQGDVGTGKTLVALLAMIVAAESGYQSAFMAPTEILAEQHCLTFRRLLAKSRYQVVLLTASVREAERKQALARLASGEAAIAVGTQALIQEAVAFHRLGLAVVDEQHRFGVIQRDELRHKGWDVDTLVMTATPIPRTLALTAYGDLDVSVVDERPPGRTPIVTLRRSASDRRGIVELVARELAAGGQAFVVYPLVEDSEKLEDVRAATSMAEHWRQALPDARVALLHGRLRGEEKDAVMRGFSSGATRLLVATTVIEVGVDVPAASLMVIEHAERFGLAQLHQLRGRVGRGPRPSRCVLISHGRLQEQARERLDAMVETDNGFTLAERDLEIRGPGDFFGTRQSGLPNLRVARLLRDGDLLEEARAAAAAHLSLPGPEHPPLREFLRAGGWEHRFGLAQVG